MQHAVTIELLSTGVKADVTSVILTLPEDLKMQHAQTAITENTF